MFSKVGGPHTTEGPVGQGTPEEKAGTQLCQLRDLQKETGTPLPVTKEHQSTLISTESVQEACDQ